MKSVLFDVFIAVFGYSTLAVSKTLWYYNSMISGSQGQVQ